MKKKRREEKFEPLRKTACGATQVERNLASSRDNGVMPLKIPLNQYQNNLVSRNKKGQKRKKKAELEREEDFEKTKKEKEARKHSVKDGYRR